MQLSPDEKRRLALRAGTVFSPAAPIRARDVFAGRTDQVRRTVDAINQSGQHALIYGERGVGKTSLANVIAGFLESVGQTNIIAPHVNCDTTDTFSSIWRKICRQIPLIRERRGLGFKPDLDKEVLSLSEEMAEVMSPDDVLHAAELVSAQHLFIPIIDEFDRLADRNAARLLTDTIKCLSDQVSATTVVLVGVADTVEELIDQHQSVERALIQIRMPRMSDDELAQIIETGVGALQMTVTQEARDLITRLSKGLPHYTHLLALHGVREAIDGDSMELEVQHVDGAIGKAITDAQHTLQRAYHQATMSQRRDALYAQVLLAAALARTDDLGYFAAGDVRDPMSMIMGRRYDIPAFSPHLSQFCESSRGPVLERTGVPRRYRFRFRNPLLQPFVIMQGLSGGMLDKGDIDRFRSH